MHNVQEEIMPDWKRFKKIYDKLLYLNKIKFNNN